MKDLEPQKSSSPPKKQILSKIIIFTLLFTLISLLLLLIPLCLIFILLQQDVITLINPNRIYLPPGQSLYDLHKHTYRDGRLYGYERELLVLEEEEDFEPIVGVEMNDDNENELLQLENENDNIVISATPYDEFKRYVRCEGTCECFMEDEERRIQNLVYSSRYASIVLVSALGLAVSKFVSDNIDDCYDKARDALGHNEDEDGEMRSSMLSCVMNMAGDDTGDDKEEGCNREYDPYDKELWEDERYGADELDPSTDDPERDNSPIRDVWRCNGHCVKMIEKAMRIYHNEPEDVEAFELVNCEKQWAGAFEITVSEKEMINPAAPRGETPWSADHISLKMAHTKYRMLYLMPFCRMIRIDYTAYRVGKDEARVMHPCVATINHMDKSNVDCFKKT